MQISARGLVRDLLTNLNPRELLYWTVGNGIYAGFHLGMRVQLFGVAEHYGPPAPATLVLSTHKRDWDPILFATYGYYHRGWLAPDGRRIGFAGRSDIWDRGFLATVVGYRNWPVWVQRLLDATHFAPLANRVRAYPILRVPEYTLRQYFRVLLDEEGDVPLSAVLSLEMLQAFARREDALAGGKHGRRTGPRAMLRLSDALGWDYRGLTNRSIHTRHLTPARYAHLQDWLRRTIDQQLETLARSMDGGETLWFAPEGAVTLDGRVMRLRSGLYTLLARARPDARVLPSNVTYDFMTNKRRMIACLAVGPELREARYPDRAEQAREVGQALALQTVVTMSQLGSRCLLACLENQTGLFTPQAEAPRLLAQARRLARQGAWVQRDLLTARGLRRRLRAFVAYARAQRLLILREKGVYLVSPQPLKSSSSRYWENPVRYCANELAALEAALQLRQAASNRQRDIGSKTRPLYQREPPDQIGAGASGWWNGR
jgi:hypothetical protein